MTCTDSTFIHHIDGQCGNDKAVECDKGLKAKEDTNEKTTDNSGDISGNSRVH